MFLVPHLGYQFRRASRVPLGLEVGSYVDAPPQIILLFCFCDAISLLDNNRRI
jgi:hypothetical protein